MNSFPTSMRPLLVVFCALLVALCTDLTIESGLDAAAIKKPPTTMDMAYNLVRRLSRIRETSSKPGTRRVLYVGDSTALPLPSGGAQAQARAIPARLEASLRKESDTFELFPLIYFGQWILDDYFLADEIIAAEPDFVVLSFNAASITPTWMALLSHPEASGWLRGRRILGALELPIERMNITIDQIMLFNLLSRPSLVDHWRWVRGQQARVDEGWKAMGTAADALVFGRDVVGRRRKSQLVDLVRTMNTDSRGMAIRRHYRGVLEGVAPSHPLLQLLSATVEHLSRAGIHVVVFVLPIDVERLKALDIDAATGLARSIESLSDVVEHAGGAFWDLHQLLPSAAFRDLQGHLRHDGSVDGPFVVAQEIAHRLLREPGAHSARSD